MSTTVVVNQEIVKFEFEKSAEEFKEKFKDTVALEMPGDVNVFH